MCSSDLQLSGIRVDQSLKFATSTRTSDLAPVAPNHFHLRFFLVAVDSSGVHLHDHGHLRSIEYVLLTGKSKCSTKNFGMTFPKSRTYVVQKCTETEVNQHFGKHPCTTSTQRNNMHNTHNLHAYTYPSNNTYLVDLESVWTKREEENICGGSPQALTNYIPNKVV